MCRRAIIIAAGRIVADGALTELADGAGEALSVTLVVGLMGWFAHSLSKGLSYLARGARNTDASRQLRFQTEHRIQEVDALRVTLRESFEALRNPPG